MPSSLGFLQMLGQKTLVEVQEVDRALCFRKSRDPAWEALSVLGGTRDVEARGAEGPDSGPGACSPMNTKSAGERRPKKGTKQVRRALPSLEIRGILYL